MTNTLNRIRLGLALALVAGVLAATIGLFGLGGPPPVSAQADTTAPTISSVAITSDTGDNDSYFDDDGVYGIGDAIKVTVTFSENVTVTGAPQLELDIGGSAKSAAYDSVDGSAAVFSYTVVEGDSDDDGVAISADKLTLNGGSIKDAADNAANLSHDALAAQNNHRVDGLRPTISEVLLVSSKGGFDDIYVPGETLFADVVFNEDVLVAGSPRLALDFQGTNRLADFDSLSPKCESLVCNVEKAFRGIRLGFKATVMEGDEDKDGVAIAANALTLNGGTIEDAAGNGAVLTHDAVGPYAGFLVDGVPPTISDIAITSRPGDDNSYGIGDQVEVTVTFDEDVTVSENWAWVYLPRLMLNIGGKTKVAKYVVSSSPDPMKFMIFTYTVEDGDSDNNGIAVGANKLQLLATKVYDTPAKNPADITHQALPDDPGHMVSTPASSTESEETSTTQKSGLLKITGEARVGELLTADTSGITDDDGLDHAVFQYLWFSDYVPIDIGLSGGISYPDYETAPDYEITSWDAGTAIQIKVTFYDDAGNHEERVSANAIQVPGCPRGEALPVWSADMSVVEYTSVSIGADGSDLFSNVCGSSDFRIKSLWSYTQGRDLRLAFEDPIPNAEDLTLHVSDLALPFPTGSSGQSNFKWTDVDVDWEDGQTISVTIVQTLVTVEPQPNTQATGAPTITGTPQVGEILRARTSGIADADGLTNANFAYEWVSGGSKISRVTGSRYTPDEGDVGTTIQVTVTFTDDAENEETLTSEPTAEVVAMPSEVTIIGEARVGETLTANVDGITDEDGIETATFHYTWSGWYYLWGRMFAYQSSSDPNYTLKEWDLGNFFVLTVTFEDDEGNEEERTSSPSALVKPANNPATGLPIISGEPRVGETLSADTSGISDPDGLDEAAFSYQWVSSDGTEDTDIAGATAATYTPSASDLSKTIKVRVSFTDNAGNAVSLTSVATATVAPTVPTEPLRLTVSRGSQVQELDASWEAPDSNGGSAITGYRVQWKETADSWDTAADVSEAAVAGTTHTITGLTGGAEYAVRVVAINDVGAGPASSEATGTPAGGVSQQNVEPENSQASGRPAVSGSAQVGQTLTADTSGIADEDGLTNVVFSYQWMADDTNIRDATGSSYTLTEDDEGKTITVTVSFTDAEGNPETLTSDPTGEVAAKPNIQATGQPTISGTVRVGETLTADVTGIADEDGLNQVVFSYQWIRNDGNADEDIAGATGSSYTLTGDDEGKTVKVTVSFTDDSGNTESLPSYPTGKVAAKPNSDPTGAPAISGTAQVGQTLTANVTGIDDEDGLENAEFTYQWIRNDGTEDADIPGATASTHTPDENDVGKALKVRVSFTDDADHGETLTSPPTAAVTAAAVTAPPLTATLDSVPASHDGSTVFTFELHFSEEFKLSYLVLRDQAFTITGGTVSRATRVDKGLNIKREIHVQPDGDGAVTIVLPVTTDCADDGAICTVDGKKLSTRLELTVSGPGGAPPTTDEPAPNTQATGLPTISGTVRVGETLTADVTGIADEDGLTNVVFSYQWMAYDTNIQDATGSSYTLVSDDEGRTIKVTVSFTDAEGHQESRTSEPTGAVEAAPNTSATGQPTISGTVRVGETLTADVTGIADEDGLTNVVFSYQWMAYDTNIQDATGSSYTLVSDDEGTVIKVTVSFTDAEGHQESRTSEPTGAVEAAPNTSATGQPTISGTVRVGETLTADVTGIADEDGLTNVVFSYQWMADEDIAGATGSSYTLTKDDKGKTIKVIVSFTDAEGNPETLTSDPTGEVAAKPNTQATGAPTISGTAQVGETLTADVTGIADEDGLDNVVFSYQWLADEAEIQGATGSGYTLAAEDEGKAIKVTVSFTDAEGHQESRTSEPTGAVEAAPNTSATGQPTISGTAQVGQTLTADTSGIADEDGLDNVTFSYQWMADDANIQGATDRAYTLADRDEGKTIKVIVSFTDDANNEESLPSAATDAVVALPGKPQSLAGKATAQEIKLTWKAPTGPAVVEYVVYRGILQNGSMNGQALSKYATIDAAGQAMTYTDDNVEEGVEYRYRVAAVNSAGEGKKSNWLDITAEEPSS